MSCCANKFNVSDGMYGQIYGIVRMIPAGRVASYGQIAAIAGCSTPRMVGYAMAAVSSGSDIPWHRVVNSRGEISVRSTGDICHDQRMLLEKEGIQFNEKGRIDLRKFAWDGPSLDE